MSYWSSTPLETEPLLTWGVDMGILPSLLSSTGLLFPFPTGPSGAGWSLSLFVPGDHHPVRSRQEGRTREGPIGRRPRKSRRPGAVRCGTPRLHRAACVSREQNARAEGVSAGRSVEASRVWNATRPRPATNDADSGHVPKAEHLAVENREANVSAVRRTVRSRGWFSTMPCPALQCAVTSSAPIRVGFATSWIGHRGVLSHPRS